MSSVARVLVSEAEFLALPETPDRIELVEGEVYVAPSPSYWHQRVLIKLVSKLEAWAGNQKGPIILGQAPLDVRLGPNRILQPDAFVAFAELDPKHKGPLDIVPALCIEVLSENRIYDRVTKRLLYAEAGVHELWTVEPTGEVEVWTGPGLARSELQREKLASSVLPGFMLELPIVF